MILVDFIFLAWVFIVASGLVLCGWTLRDAMADRPVVVQPLQLADTVVMPRARVLEMRRRRW